MPPIRVLIVDDSVVVRQVLSEFLRSDPEIEIVGTASSGSLALSLIPQLKPDLVTLDLEMPGMDGLETLAGIRKLSPRLPVIMFSTFTERGAAITLEALSRGATDYVTKPSQTGSADGARQRVRDELIPKIKSLCAPRVPFRLPVATIAPKGARVPIDIVAIGTSTGGPNALADLIPQFPADFPVPIVIVQHMPPMFTRQLAERLNALTPLLVQEAQEGKKLTAGQVWIAPGDYHMTVARRASGVVLTMNQRPSEQACRPSVDVLFRSVAETFGAHALAVVLTGMGADGTRGAQAIREAGGEVIVQDEATSVIWGMPGSVVAAGQADRICPLRFIAAEVVRRVSASRQLANSSWAAVAR
ncbi:MAG TPA: chemotaxis response regulator protein-glutamate methylesterase [Terriglobales bacterium]